MSKEMTLDVLSSIKGAKASQVVDDLFEVIKQGFVADANSNNSNNLASMAVNLEDLRQDVVVESPALERELIIENFPKSKNGYLVVAKVIEE
jgi:Asp-tRNA(Asn)/Glu-tRNA(Gln) amidotransferase C subunit